MHILLNGESRDVPQASTIETLLLQFGYDAKGIAVAINREFVSRSTYATVTLNENDEVEIVAPMQGG